MYVCVCIYMCVCVCVCVCVCIEIKEIQYGKSKYCNDIFFTIYFSIL